MQRFRWVFNRRHGIFNALARHIHRCLRRGLPPFQSTTSAGSGPQITDRQRKSRTRADLYCPSNSHQQHGATGSYDSHLPLGLGREQKPTGLLECSPRLSDDRKSRLAGLINQRGQPSSLLPPDVSLNHFITCRRCNLIPILLAAICQKICSNWVLNTISIGTTLLLSRAGPEYQTTFNSPSKIIVSFNQNSVCGI